tara:strand:+ start:4688 stop:5350 length:663 start_codon:yes stop_codon:yes gene_type:complete
MIGFPFFVIICLVATAYFIVTSVKKAKQGEQKNKSQKKRAFPKKKSLSITVHLFKDGYGEKKFQLKKGHQFYVNEDGLKEISSEWDYDFWQITSNKSEYAFEWLREDQNNNNISTLNFWNGGDLSKSKQSISEDSALDIIQNSDWIPGLDKLLNKKNNLPNNSDDKNPLSNHSIANDKGKLGKNKMSSWTQKETKNKVTSEKNTKNSEAEEPTLSKGFGK